jgi:glycosyltransferase involved in cell wall biosynthesis
LNSAQYVSQAGSAESDTRRLPLSVTIITFNEETNLPRCLASAQGLAKEIIIIDSGSTDGTGAIARQFGAVFEVHPWQGHVAQKNIALRRCSQPWVLAVDADEALTPELATAIRQVFGPSGPAAAGYWINRRTFYLGAWIRHTWHPEWRLRLVRREGAEWRGIDPHDKLEVPGVRARLNGDLLHYSYRDLEHQLRKMISYARISADSYARVGRSFHWYQLGFSPLWAFLKRLVFKQAWRDGWRGWLLAVLAAFQTFIKYAFLLERKLNPHREVAASAAEKAAPPGAHHRPSEGPAASSVRS